MDIMMRNAYIQPSSALPVTRNMPYYSASVPTRNQPRNMTGIYLGLEGNIKPPPGPGSQTGRMRKGGSQKIRTPTEDRRYRMVELLRIKEDKRGFKGQILKKRNSLDSLDEENMVPDIPRKEQLKHRKWGPAKSANPQRFEDVIRQNPRNYTNIVNSGVTRSENLTGIMSFAEEYGWDTTNVPITDALVEEVSRITKEREDLLGLEECFKKVCKGNKESINSLLPLRKQSARSDNYETGFTVRSYRNPKNAELLAHFDGAPSTIPQSRPKTVPARSVHDPRQPHVPAPYFFKYYNKPLTAHSSKKRNSPTTPFDETATPVNSERIIGLPGSGFISKPRTGRSTAWSEGDAIRVRKGTPRTESPVKDTDRLTHNTPHHDSSLSLFSNQPLEVRAEGYRMLNNNSTTGTTGTADEKSTVFSDRNAEPPNTERTESTAKSVTEGTEKSVNIQNKQASLKGNNSSMDGRIRLDLETEDGKKQQIILDDKDAQHTDDSEKVKASEAKIASMQEVAKQRKKDFEQILDEHAEIVTRITRQSSSESGNETFQAENERDQ